MANRNGPSITYGDFEFDPIRGFPVPQISLSTNANRTQAGTPFNYQTDVTLNGLIYGFTGYNNDCENPSTLDQNTGFGFLVDAAKELQGAFVQDNQKLVIDCVFAGGGTPTPLLVAGGDDSGQILRVNNISFNESQDLWAITIPYTINLSVFSRSGITGSGSGYPGSDGPVGTGFLVSSVGDSLSITPDSDKSYYAYDTTAPDPRIPFEVNDRFGQTILQGNLSNALNPYVNAEGFPTYTVTRTVTAQGLSAGTGIDGAVRNAQEWCEWQVENQPIESLTSDLNLYNFLRTINADAPAGSYTISDTYKAVKSTGVGTCDKWLETFEVSQDTRNDGTKTVTINGTIEGLEVTAGLIDCDTSTPVNPIVDDPAYDGTSGVLYPTHSGTEMAPQNTKYANALSGWYVTSGQMYLRCLTVFPDLQFQSNSVFDQSSPFWLNPSPINQREGFNPARGTVSFNATYDNRPLSLVPEAMGERLDINDNFSTRSTANIFVLGRRLGPVRQDLGTSTIPTRRVSYSARFPRPITTEGYSFPPSVITNIYNALGQFDPANFAADIGFTYNSVLKNDTFQYNPLDASVSVNLEWEYTKCAVG